MAAAAVLSITVVPALMILFAAVSPEQRPLLRRPVFWLTLLLGCARGQDVTQSSALCNTCCSGV